MEFAQHAFSAKLYGKKKNDLLELASSFWLESTGTVATIKKQIDRNIKGVENIVTREKSFKKTLHSLIKKYSHCFCM